MTEKKSQITKKKRDPPNKLHLDEMTNSIPRLVVTSSRQLHLDKMTSS